MRIIVTGGAGFIASNIVDALIEKGNDVAILDDMSTGKTENINHNAAFYKSKVEDPAIVKIFENFKPEIVIHHAAQINVQKSLVDPVFDATVNILGTINLLECMKKAGVRKIIYASSAAVYGNPEYLGIDENHDICPMSFYGISKHTPEHYIKVYSDLYGLDYTILRYANAYGIRQDPMGEGGVVSIFVNCLLNNVQAFIYGDGSQTRDFVYVKDIVESNLKALNSGDHEIINIGTGQATSILELFNKMKDITGSSMQPVFKDARKGDIMYSYYNKNKAKNVLGWEPKYDIDKGLKETLDYYKSLYNKRLV